MGLEEGFVLEAVADASEEGEGRWPWPEEGAALLPADGAQRELPGGGGL